jgi:hypothetical protein
MLPSLYIATICLGICVVNATDAENLFTFRHPWENRPPVSQEAKEFQILQDSCSSTNTFRRYEVNHFGLGSGLQSFSKALCNAHHARMPLYVEPTMWIWNDREFCSRQGNFSNPLECYFGPGIAASSCNLTHKMDQQGQYWVRYKCPKYVVDDGDALSVFNFEGHFYEFLFSHVNPQVVQLAKKAALEVFRSNKSPENMLTIHIR